MIIQITRKTGKLLLLCLGLILAGALYLWWIEGFPLFPERETPVAAEPEPVLERDSPDADQASEMSEADSMPQQIYVHVTGAVAHPDQVYTLPSGARLADAIEAAGGPAEGADLSLLNLACPLADGQKVRVPFVGEESTEATEVPADPLSVPETSVSNADSLTNINFASTIELQALPGIGETYARRIIAYREEHGPFASIEEIRNVKGIGDATFEKLRAYITV